MPGARSPPRVALTLSAHAVRRPRACWRSPPCPSRSLADLPDLLPRRRSAGLALGAAVVAGRRRGIARLLPCISLAAGAGRCRVVAVAGAPGDRARRGRPVAARCCWRWPAPPCSEPRRPGSPGVSARDARWRFGPRAAHRADRGGRAWLAIAAGALALPPAVPARCARSRRPSPSTPRRTDPAARLGSLSGTRVLVWSSALAAFRSQPLHGTGAGTFEFWWSRDARASEFVVDAHSLYLEPLAELGLPGLAFVLLLCGGGLLGLLRARVRAPVRRRGRRRRGLPRRPHRLALPGGRRLAVGVHRDRRARAAAGRRAPRAVALPRPARPSAVRWHGRWSCAIALLAARRPAPAAGRRLGPAGEPGRQRAATTTATRSPPPATPPRSSPGPRAHTSNWPCWPRAAATSAVAEREARDAVALEPTNWRHPLLLARVLAERGDAPARPRGLRPSA